MKINEIADDFWYRVGYFIRHDFITILMWVGKFVVGFPLIWCWSLIRWAKVIVLAGVIIPYFAAKEFLERFFERKKKKGGAR